MTESEERELAQLIDEQRKDDTHIIRPEFRYTYPLDAAFANGDGDDGSYFASMIGVDEEGEIVSFIRPFRGDVLNGGADYHGTEDGYGNHRCRCLRCRRAHTAYHASLRAKRISQGIPEHVHGTENGYGNYGCRCDRCRAARAETRRKLAERRLGPLEPRACSNESCDKVFSPRTRRARYCSKSCHSAQSKRETRRKLKAAA